MRDVRERAAVDERRLPLERLDEVRLDRVLEEDGHRARGLQLLGRHRLALERLPDRDPAEPRAEVAEVAGDRDERHDLARRGDVEARLARVAVHAAAERGDDVAQRAVVHVHATAPRDGERVDAKLVAVQQVGVDQRREQVVGGRDRVQVAGEVEVQVLHRDDLRVAAAGSAALDPEHRPERRLAEREHRPAAELAEPLRERDGRRRLALARRCRRDRGDVDDLPVRAVCEPLEDGEIDLRLVPPVELELVRLDAGLLCDVRDRAERCFLRDLEARAHRSIPPYVGAVVGARYIWRPRVVSPKRRRPRTGRLAGYELRRCVVGGLSAGRRRRGGARGRRSRGSRRSGRRRSAARRRT